MEYTWPDRLVVVVSDGSAVLGLGEIGPRASLPVLEIDRKTLANTRRSWPRAQLTFPSVIRGALDAGARLITEGIEIAAADARCSGRGARRSALGEGAR